MIEQDYSNREINEFFRDIKDSLGRIEVQTTKTNGRVNSLEESRSKFIGWSMGFGVAVSIILVLLVYIFNLRINDLSKMQNSPDINITSVTK